MKSGKKGCSSQSVTAAPWILPITFSERCKDSPVFAMPVVCVRKAVVSYVTDRRLLPHVVKDESSNET